MRTNPFVALALTGSLLLAACGGGGDDQQAVADTTTTAKPTTTTTTTEPQGPVVSMLTGLPTSEEVVARPVVAVKFDNVEGRSTPQVGIAQAEVVYEVTVEGQVTRFLALYQAHDASPIGPIRSARGSEVGLLEELHTPVFTWHGANAILDAEVRGSDIIARSFDDVPELFYREPTRRKPYDSFAVGTAEIRATAPAEATGPEAPILPFAQPGQAVPSPVAVPATSVSIVFPDPFSGGGHGTPVRFEWDGARWLRYQAGHPHVDGAGAHLAVDNVIVRFTGALDSGTVDQAGSRVPTAQVIGEGEAWVFSAGKVATGTWSKPDGRTPTTYRDQTGAEIALTPGTTWIALPYGHGSSFR